MPEREKKNGRVESNQIQPCPSQAPITRSSHQPESPHLSLRLDGVLSLGEMDGLLLGLLQGLAALVLRQASADGARLLWSEVEG